ncbi:hypothetical protein [Heyndrickxia sporothermodurans]|uniref:Uncharacterized protein n=1 Tax=Heyndrickxia sporothermodurans TaxID=46224 RepID=A0AB37HM56_9BACI|nr:hypothetical protein [Heyndrickxia sporothermodurans]MBL5768013.1 hypothetical protein [Heyndrickxia sporothermodurans]MBL5771607.1 hypothetical protein [Heyndrickxia sporothermodurans]MBL5785893.1 hypothetical protein [Heyndrickxia sporothermodurans]MBL5789399.1 hypothetical protein [Heyndrickxia sporothermodurans]MBL5796650.1 hypothetical protein [Heyndrickxia sporothermodurans]
MEIKLDYRKYGVNKCDHTAAMALFCTIGYLRSAVESDNSSSDVKIFSEKVLNLIKQELKVVLIEEEK